MAAGSMGTISVCNLVTPTSIARPVSLCCCILLLCVAAQVHAPPRPHFSSESVAFWGLHKHSRKTGYKEVRTLSIRLCGSAGDSQLLLSFGLHAGAGSVDSNGRAGPSGAPTRRRWLKLSKDDVSPSGPGHPAQPGNHINGDTAANRSQHAPAGDLLVQRVARLQNPGWQGLTCQLLCSRVTSTDAARHLAASSLWGVSPRRRAAEG